MAFGMEDKKDGEKRKVMSAKEWHGEVEEGGGTVHGEVARTGGREPPRSVVLRGRRKRGVRPLLDLRERELDRKGREMSSKAGGGGEIQQPAGGQIDVEACCCTQLMSYLRLPSSAVRIPFCLSLSSFPPLSLEYFFVSLHQSQKRLPSSYFRICFARQFGRGQTLRTARRVVLPLAEVPHAATHSNKPTARLNTHPTYKVLTHNSAT